VNEAWEVVKIVLWQVPFIIGMLGVGLLMWLLSDEGTDVGHHQL